jgi:hypothetical protein
MEKRKTTKNSAVYTTHHLANIKIPAQQLMNDTATSYVTYTVGITQPVVLLTHPFDACMKAAQSASFTEGAQEVQVLVAKWRDSFVTTRRQPVAYLIHWLP